MSDDFMLEFHRLKVERGALLDQLDFKESALRGAYEREAALRATSTPVRLAEEVTQLLAELDGRADLNASLRARVARVRVLLVPSSTAKE